MASTAIPPVDDGEEGRDVGRNEETGFNGTASNSANNDGNNHNNNNNNNNSSINYAETPSFEGGADSGSTAMNSPDTASISAAVSIGNSGSHTTDEVNSADQSLVELPELVERGEWDEIREWYEGHPHELRHIDQSTGSTVLHALCSAPSTPSSLLEFVVDQWPDALTVQEKRFGATPLHILVWTSQRSVSKVEVLLQRLNQKDVMIRNRVLGSTILHSACGNNAELGVLKAIVKKHKPIVLAKTFDQNHTAVHAVWHPHMNCIPGHMQIASILRGGTTHKDSPHFQRFWSKIEFLAMEAFKLSPACPSTTNTSQNADMDNDNDDFDARPFILHGLLDLRAPLNCLKVALKVNPEWASVVDADGNYPLHIAVKRRPFRVKDAELIQALIQAYPQAASIKNNDGDAPIHTSIREKMVWEQGLNHIVDANADVLATLDTKTGLYPFLLSASLGGRVAVNTTYQLILSNPFLIKGAIENNVDEME